MDIYYRYWQTTFAKAGHLGIRRKQQTVELQNTLAERLLQLPFIEQKNLQKTVNYLLLLDSLESSNEKNLISNPEAVKVSFSY